MKNNIIESLLIIYTTDEGKLKVLLKKNDKEPYKGYWIIPGEPLTDDMSLKENSKQIFKNITNIKIDDIKPAGIYNEINIDDQRIIELAYTTIIDKKTVDLKKEDSSEWFDIDKLPKIGFNHKEILEKSIEDIKEKIIFNSSNIILDFFKNDFTLSELQSFYENIIGKKIDRRNFRKKILSQDIIIDTGEKTKMTAGRPGKLYIFNKENMKGKIIWNKMVGV